MPLRALGMSLAGFLSGSVMFSATLVRATGRDIRRFGDGNPGAINAFRAGGWRVGVPALLLDFLKGAVPVSAARWLFGVEGFWLVPVALAPVLGHAFSPFLRGRGGKAIAVTFGSWCGLTLWQGPTVLGAGLLLAWLLVGNDGWKVMLGLSVLLGWLLAFGPNPVNLAVWAGTAAVLAYRHRRELGQPIKFRFARRARRDDA